MWKKYIPLFVIFTVVWLIMPNAAFAQEKKDTLKSKKTVNVRGRVFENESLNPLEGATIRLLKSDSTMVAGTTTDKSGLFLLTTAERGTFTLRVSFIGFQTQQFKVELTEKKGNFKTSDILLREDAKMMAEAVVTGVLPEMTIVEDTTVYHADAFALPEGSMVEDLIKRLPGVVEEDDGSLTWNGKQISQILVDGKEFFGNNRDLVMKNLPSDIVDKVKAYDRQSDLARLTGIDDGNERTVLDLAIKKEKKKGVFGQAEGGYGTSDRYQGRANVNRFEGKNKYSAVANATNTRGNGMTDRQEGGINVSIENKKVEFDASANVGFDQSQNERVSNSQSFVRKSYNNTANTSHGHSHTFGIDMKLEWKIDSMTKLIARPNFSLGGNDNTSHSINATFNDNPYATASITDPILQIDELPRKILVNTRTNAGFNKGNNMNGGGSLQINRKFNKKGRNLSLGLNGGFGQNDSQNDTYNKVDYYRILAVSGEDSIYNKTQYNSSTSRNWNASARLSYTEPVGDNMFLQMSYNYSYRYTNHDRDVSSIFDPRNEELGVNLFNYAQFFSYSLPDTAQCNATENIYQNHSIDLQYRIVRTKYRLTAGVNVQPQSNAVDYTKGFKHFDVSRTVVNASPTIDFRYRFSKEENLRIRYGGSTGQPNITDLIPDTLNNANPLNIRLGNPDLKPSFTQGLQAEYRKNIPALQRNYNAELQFHTTQNSTSSRTEYNDETGARITQPVNVNGNWNTRGSFGFNTAFSDQRFRMGTNTNGSITNAVGYIYKSQTKESVRNRTRGYRIGQSLRFTFHSKTFEANINGGIDYNHSRSTSSEASNLDTYSYHYGGSINWQLPWHMTFGSDINMRSRRGYADAQMNTNQLLWNMHISQRLLKRRNLILSVRAVDILNQRDEVNRRITESARIDSQSNMVHQYVLFSAAYRFGHFGGKKGGGSKRKDDTPSY